MTKAYTKVEAAPGRCSTCKIEIELRGKLKRRFCSDDCRMSWHKERRAKAAELLARAERGSTP